MIVEVHLLKYVFFFINELLIRTVWHDTIIISGPLRHLKYNCTYTYH